MAIWSTAATSTRDYLRGPVDAFAPDIETHSIAAHGAAEAIERILITFESLPFVIDPLDSLRPGGPDARLDGVIKADPIPDLHARRP